MKYFLSFLLILLKVGTADAQFKAADYYRIANAKFNTGDFESALKDISVAIDLDTANFKYYLKKGHILNRMEKMKDAVVEYSKSIALKPDDAESYFYRGMTYSLLDKYTSALPDLDTTLVLNPGLTSAHYYRALVKINMRTVDEGCQDMKKYLETSGPGDANYSKAQNVFKRRCKGF